MWFIFKSLLWLFAWFNIIFELIIFVNIFFDDKVAISFILLCISYYIYRVCRDNIVTNINFRLLFIFLWWTYLWWLLYLNFLIFLINCSQIYLISFRFFYLECFNNFVFNIIYNGLKEFFHNIVSIYKLKNI